MIASTYASLLESGLSARSVEQTHCVLHLALKQAMHCGIIGRNPTELVIPPRPRTREMTALNRSQLQHLLNVTAGSRWHVLWVLLGRRVCDSAKRSASSGTILTSRREGWSFGEHCSGILVGD